MVDLLSFSSREEDWISKLVAMRRAGLLHVIHSPKLEFLKEFYGERPYYNRDDNGEICKDHWAREKEVMDPSKYHWNAPVEEELPSNFRVDREIYELPRQFRMPQIYPQNFGAVVPLKSEKREGSEGAVDSFDLS
ncbi:MAG: hypothetical protein JKX94_07135 [Sneathiella sp.]|nr:hypothetical protein [Sneathiella sp.]